MAGTRRLCSPKPLAAQGAPRVSILTKPFTARLKSGHSPSRGLSIVEGHKTVRTFATQNRRFICKFLMMVNSAEVIRGSNACLSVVQILTRPLILQHYRAFPFCLIVTFLKPYLRCENDYGKLPTFIIHSHVYFLSVHRGQPQSSSECQVCGKFLAATVTRGHLKTKAVRQKHDLKPIT